jgi:hypothetical protein
LLQAVCIARRDAVRVDLGDDEDLVAPALDRFADQRLGAAVAVHLGGVDQRQAEVDAAPEGGDLFGAPLRVVAQVPGALAQRRDHFSARQANSLHARQYGRFIIGSSRPGLSRPLR